MTREKYESLPLATLKELAKARKMRGVSTLKKSDLIDAMLALDEQEEQREAATEAKEEVREELKEKKAETDIEQLDSGHTADGILEVMQDGFGFIRVTIICREKMMYMYRRHRSGDSVSRQGHPDRKHKGQDTG